MAPDARGGRDGLVRSHELEQQLRRFGYGVAGSVLSQEECTLFSKTPEANWFVAYHQDRSVPVSENVLPQSPGWSRKEGRPFVQAPEGLLRSMIAIRLHLDDTSSENDALKVIPGSHNLGVLNQLQPPGIDWPPEVPRVPSS